MLTLQGCTSFLASTFCAGSPRKLIAGLWYTIVANAIILTIICIYIINVRSSAEEFDCIWAALTLCALVVGGTMVMRSYHSSMAIGFFLGAVVGSSCLFFLLFLLFQGYALDQQMEVLSNHEEHIMSTFCIIQSILLVIFASILGAHRSDVVDQSISLSRTKSSAARIPSDGVIT